MYVLVHASLLVLKLLCILQVDSMKLYGLGVVLHECERVSQTIAGLSHKCHVTNLTGHCHSHAVVTRSRRLLYIIINDPCQVNIHNTMY